jgi:hypothetical protein
VTTLTEKLARQMARCKKAQMETLRDLKATGRIARHRHDQAVDIIQDLDRQIAADPGNEDLYRRRDETDVVRGGLVHCCSYADGMRELVTGKAPAPVSRHDTKDANGLFTKKGSLGHRIRQLLDQ